MIDSWQQNNPTVASNLQAVIYFINLMKKTTILNNISRSLFSTAASLVVAMGLSLCGNVAHAQSTNWFINFDVPGDGYATTNYFGPGAYTNTVTYVITTNTVVVTNSNSSLSTNYVNITNAINNPYYWNPIADNKTNSGSLMVLGDGTTASSSIVFANTDVDGAPGYSPIGLPVTQTFPNYNNFWALFLPYQHDGGNTGGAAAQTLTNTLYNVLPGTYDVYMYGMNADPRIATAYANSQCDRGTIFKVWSDLTATKMATTVNATNSGYFARGNNYVLIKNVVTSNGIIRLSYQANTTVYAKYNGATKLGSNGEGDFDGLQLVFVSTNTTPIPSSVGLTNMYPNGNYQYQSSPALSFIALSTNGIDTNQISISLSATMLGGQFVGQTITTNLNYVTGGITISGDLTDFTNLLISTPLLTNAMYSATITVGDLNGDSQSITFSFDTIDTSYDYVFEAEDWNYLSGRTGGQYFDNPQTNEYANLGSSSGVDYYNTIGGPSAYRSSSAGLATEICGDLPTVVYLPTNNSDIALYTNYDVLAADNVANNWANYTRTFPAGAYNGSYIVYMRAASVGGQTNAASLSVMNGTATTSTQNPTLLGYFSPADTGGQQTYEWVPLLDSNGNYAVFNGGTLETIRVTSLNQSYNGANANYSANSYLLIPVNTNYVVITNIYPNGATQFQATNALSFTINASDLVDPTNIFLSLAGTNLLGQTFATNLTGSALTITGPANSQVVSISLSSNTVYTAAIQISDASGITVATNLSFDTVNPAYYFEAEDFDYYYGQFYDTFATPANPGNAVNIDALFDAASFGAPAILYVDDFDIILSTNGTETDQYGRGGLETENCGDTLRPAYATQGFGYLPNLPQDYDIGNGQVGNWANYTRNYPVGTYNVYIRGASPNAQADSATLSLLTSGYATSNQTTTVLGTFAVPATGGNQTYAWVPLTVNGGQLAQVTFDGSQQTLRVTWDSTGFNANYFMLVPVDTTLPVISSVYPDGQHQFQASANLSFTAASSAGFNPSGISVQLTGTDLLGQTFVTNITTANGLVVTGPSTDVSVSAPLVGNTVYTAVITVITENSRTATSTVSFDTVNPSYTFEAEDFNYGGGQFIDNPPVDAYSNLMAVVGIDTYDTNFNTGGQIAYRTNGLNTEVASDKPRSSYAGGLADYDVGANSSGNWGDYTRTFPSGVYNIFIRGSSPAGQSDAASVSLVTNATSISQTATVLGTVTLPATGAYQTYTWAPFKDSSGNLMQIVGGSQETLRVTVDGGNFNANYYMLMPANTTLPATAPPMTALVSGGGAHIGGNITFSFPTLYGYNYYLDYKTNLLQTAWVQLLGPLPGNTTTQTFNDTIGTGDRFYRLRVQ